MDITTILKVLIISFMYLGFGPTLGFLLKDREKFRRVTLGFMAWWLVRPPGDFTLMLYSIESYRGHTKGFEFNYLEAISIGLAFAALLEKRKDFKWLPPGLSFWLLWICMGMLSIPGAYNSVYAMMPAFKFAKMAFVFVGVFSALHDERDVLAIMRGFAIALLLQLWICLWGRYVQGGFRIRGWFEHENPMSMWTYQLAFPILGLALTKQTKPRDVLLFFSAYGAAALVVVLSVSRASLAALVAGTLLVVGASYLQGITARKALVTMVMVICGSFVMYVASDTFMARVESAGDSEPENDLRYVLNKQSAAMYHDHPLTGLGWNNYGIMNSRPHGEIYSKFLEDWEANRGRAIYPEDYERNALTESLYWLMLAENGSTGFGSFMLFALVTLWFGFRNFIGFWKSSLGMLVLGITVALIITYVHGTVERVLTQTKNLTTWVILCTILSRVEWWRKEQKRINYHLRQSGR